MYRFKNEKKEEFLEGRKITYIADRIGITREFLTNILNNKMNCSKLVAYCLTKVLNPEREIADYFDCVKKGE